MDNDLKAWLYDILTAVMEIESFFNDTPKEFSKYQSDLRTKRAVERNIEIIGETLSRILKCDEAIVITNSRKIVDTRNRIIHGYDSVSDDVIWGIVIRHLPILKIEIEALLGDRNAPHNEPFYKVGLMNKGSSLVCQLLTAPLDLYIV